MGLPFVLPPLKDEHQATRLSRPNSWGFDLSSVASSGYCSAENSTESEYPPFDWDYVREKLEDLEKTEVSVEVPQETQYTLSECFFKVHIIESGTKTVGGRLRSPISQNHSRALESYVVGPSGNQYEVSQTPGIAPSEVICTFRPLECGPHTCHVMLLHGNCTDPEPFVINIDRTYGDTNPITSMDIELPSDGNEDSLLTQRKPWGICANKKTDVVYVADRERHEVLVYGPDGELLKTIGKHGRGKAEFFRPTAVAYDATRDRLLVADKDNHRVQILTAEGHFILSFGRRGNFPGQFFFPWGVAVSRDGKYIVVADSRNHRIQLFTHDGKFLRKFNVCSNDKSSTAYKKEFDYPRGVCFDPTGRYIYVTDFNLHTIFRVPIDFRSYEKFVEEDTLKRPQGITVDDCGNILVCDSRNNSVRVISKEGKMINEIRCVGSKGALELPLDIDIMKGGYVALLDMNGRVRLF